MFRHFAKLTLFICLPACASWKQVSCYEKDGQPSYQAEVHQVGHNKFIQYDGSLKSVKGLCVHDHPGFWNRATGGIFDSMERGQ